MKSLLTHITSVPSTRLCASVFVHVIIKTSFTCETLFTFITNKQLLSSVRPFMCHQVAYISHLCITKPALVWLLSSVNEHVTPHALFGDKSLLTHITNVSFHWLSASVFVHVMHKAAFPRETLSTVGTST